MASQDLGTANPSVPNAQQATPQEAESSLPPFISSEPKVGDPPLAWGDFKYPRLRRFPGSPDDFELRRFLGRGVDGYVIKARVKGQDDPVAIKVFPFNHQPPDGYWPFQRECVNRALLEKIETSLQRAAADGQPIYVNPRPTTRDDAIRNLWAFSSEGRARDADSSGRPHRDGFVPFSAPGVQVTGCQGWTKFKGADINAFLKRTRARCILDLEDDETYYAIVYAYISRDGFEEVDVDTVAAQMEFFHVAGFHNVEFKPDNWRGAGVLVDFGDIASPFAGRSWVRSLYSDNQPNFASIVRYWAERGGLRWPYIIYHPPDPPRPSNPLPSSMLPAAEQAGEED